MKNLVKRTLALATALIMLLGLAACGGNGGGKVNSPAQMTYFVVNPIKIERINAFTTGEPKPENYPRYWQYEDMSPEVQADYDINEVKFQGEYIQISGLKDKEVEEKINTKIKEHYLEYIDYIPPYRGIKLAIGEDPTLVAENYSSKSISMYMYGSFNNILSISFSGTTTYNDAAGRVSDWGYPVHHYVNFAEPLNFDLNTGEQIEFEDLFCDDIDIYEYVNGFIKETLVASNADDELWSMPGDTLKLTGAFETIEPDQKFTLNRYGVNLIFDYETEELNGSSSSIFNYSQIVMPYSEKFAVTERFYDEDVNIYESEADAKKVFVGTVTRDEPLGDSEREYRKIDRTDVYMRATVAEGTPQQIRYMLEEFIAISDEEVIAELEPTLSEAIANEFSEGSVDSQYQRTADTTIVGPYLDVSMSTFKYIHESNQSAYLNNYNNGVYLNEHREENLVYDMREFEAGKEPEPIELADLFYEGVDYEQAIKDAMWATVNELVAIDREIDYKPGDVVVEMTEKDKEYIDAYYDAITGFSVLDEYLYISVPRPQDIFWNVYHIGVVNNHEYGSRLVYDMGMIEYNKLGNENIKIFD